MQIIKDGRIVEDHWRHLGDADEAEAGPVTVSAARWRSEREALLARPDTGLRLTGSDDVAAIASDIAHWPLIVLEFTAMADGRSFSSARLLRERYGYTGELRARGAFIRDQMFFLTRVGVNAFELADEGKLAAALSAFSDFSVRYQAATDEPAPLYRRRGRAGHGSGRSPG